MGVTASHAQFKIETKTSTILRSNKMSLHYLAKVRKSLKLFPPVKQLIPEFFKYPPPHPTLSVRFKDSSPCSEDSLLHFEVVSHSVAHSFSTLRSCEPHPLSVANQSLRQQLPSVSASHSQNSIRHVVLRRATGHRRNVSLKKL
jgi:hypothetical protein